VGSNFYFYEQLGLSVIFALLGVMPFVLLGLAIPYAVLRLRDAQNRQADPQLGLKVVMHYFFSLGILIALSGLTVWVVDFILQLDLFRGSSSYSTYNREPFPNGAQRTGMGLIVSGGIFIGLHLVFLLALTGTRDLGAVRRMFVGWRFAIHGLVLMVAGTFLAILLFQKDEGQWNQQKQTLIGILIVWAPSWLLHLVLLALSSPRPRTRSNIPSWEPQPFEWEEPPRP
jgi:hypothetical protein